MSWISLDFVEFGENYEMYSEFPYDIRHKYKLNVLNGCIDKHSYKIYNLGYKYKRRLYKHHRLIYYALVEPFDWNDKNIVIDHKNHNKLDNRIENLRLVTQSENLRNMSNYKGVDFIFVKDLPDKIVVNEEHKIYYSPSSDKFYIDLGIHFRQMKENKNHAHYRIHYKYKGKQYDINTTKWRKDNGY